MTAVTSTMQLLAAQAEAARKAHGEAVAHYAGRTEYTGEYLAKKTQELRAELAETVAALTEKYRAEKERLATADRIADTRPADVQMLDDARRATAWQRVRERLENGTTWRQVADDAIDADDPVMLAALSERLANHMADQLPANTAGRRTRTAGIRVDVRGHLDPLVAAHGTGVHQRAAQIRQEVTTATELANVAISGAQATSLGRYDALGASIAAHYAQSAADATVAP